MAFVKKKSRVVCPYGGEKSLYPSRASAQAFIDNLPNKFGHPEKVKTSRIYYCSGCGGYHITTRPALPKTRATNTRFRPQAQQGWRPKPNLPAPQPPADAIPDRTALCHSNNHVLIPGRIYRHFKGDFYRVITTAKHVDTNESFVVYELLYKKHKRTRIRPFAEFMSEVDRTKYPYAAQKYRYELQDVDPRIARPHPHLHRK